MSANNGIGDEKGEIDEKLLPTSGDDERFAKCLHQGMIFPLSSFGTCQLARYSIQ